LEPYQRYLAFRASLVEDPEWHDGEIIYANLEPARDRDA
jgi:hypothetical protein